MPTQAELNLIRGPSNVITQDFSLLEKMLSVLDCLEGQHLLSMTEISRQTGIPRTTCQRLLQALQRHHMVHQEGRCYGLGSRMFSYVYSDIVLQPLRTLARPYLRKLRIETNMSAALFVRQGAFRVAIAVDEGVEGPVHYLDVGQTGVVYAGSPSHVLMAWLNKSERDSILSQLEWVPITERTPVSHDVFERTCKEVRKRGYAISLGEREPNAFSISVPVHGSNQRVVAALALSGPLAYYSNEKARQWVPLLKESGRALSAAIKDHM